MGFKYSPKILAEFCGNIMGASAIIFLLGMTGIGAEEPHEIGLRRKAKDYMLGACRNYSALYAPLATTFDDEMRELFIDKSSPVNEAITAIQIQDEIVRRKGTILSLCRDVCTHTRERYLAVSVS